MILIPLSARPLLLDALLDGLDTWVHLAAQPFDSDVGLSLSALVEPDWDGYAPQRVTTWMPALLIGEIAHSMADPLEWQRGTGGTADLVWGYYVTDTRTGPLLWAESVCGRPPLVMASPGDVCVVWPRLTLPGEPGVPCVAVMALEMSGSEM